MLQLNQILCIISLLFACSILPVSHAACNSCMPNQAACVNVTSYNMCFDGQLDRTSVFNCPPNYVCTSLSIICMEQGSYDPACDLDAECGTCNADKPFTCISRTQYAQCIGNVRTTNIGTCPSGKVCNTSNGKICVDQCVEPECSRVTPA